MPNVWSDTRTGIWGGPQTNSRTYHDSMYERNGYYMPRTPKPYGEGLLGRGSEDTGYGEDASGYGVSSPFSGLTDSFAKDSVTKAGLGLALGATPEQIATGMASSGFSGFMNGLSGIGNELMGGMLGADKTSKFFGNLAGLATNMAVPGLGYITAPLGTMAVHGIQDAIDSRKHEKIFDRAEDSKGWGPTGSKLARDTVKGLENMGLTEKEIDMVADTGLSIAEMQDAQKMQGVIDALQIGPSYRTTQEKEVGTVQSLKDAIQKNITDPISGGVKAITGPVVGMLSPVTDRIKELMAGLADPNRLSNEMTSTDPLKSMKYSSDQRQRDLYGQIQSAMQLGMTPSKSYASGISPTAHQLAETLNAGTMASPAAKAALEAAMRGHEVSYGWGGWGWGLNPGERASIKGISTGLSSGGMMGGDGTGGRSSSDDPSRGDKDSYGDQGGLW